MKKFIALLLAAMLLMGVTCAVAEKVEVAQATADFDVTMVIPEGYAMTEDRNNGNLYINVMPEDEAAAGYYISIGYSEEYDGDTLSELSDEEAEQISEILKESFANPSFEQTLTAEGTMVYVFRETEGESDWALAVTVYKGYFIAVQIEKADYSQLCDEDVQRAIDLLSDMHFVED